MKRELEERCNEVTKDLLGSLKNLKKEKKENEKNDKVYATPSSVIQYLNDNNG